MSDAASGEIEHRLTLALFHLATAFETDDAVLRFKAEPKAKAGIAAVAFDLQYRAEGVTPDA